MKQKWLIIIIIIIVILGLSKMGTKKTYDVKKRASTTPLVISDLQNINGDGLTTNPIPGAVSIIFFETIGGNWMGQLHFEDFYYLDLYEPFPGNLKIEIMIDDFPSSPVEIIDGDYVIITYDGGKTKNIYLPYFYIDGTRWQTLELYVADDGSTYYDGELTELAKEAPSSPDCNTLKSTALSSITNWANNPTQNNKDLALQAIVEWANNC